MPVRPHPAAVPLTWGPLTLASRYLLAPLAGYTNLPFRLALREIGGVGLATTDLVNASAILRGSRRTLELLKTCPEDRPLAVQIYGADVQEMQQAAQWLEAYGVSSIDINMGCPVHKVVRHGGGSALMCDQGKALALVRSVVEAVRLPVTVKMRLGWDDASWSAPHFAREFEQAGVAAVIVHGRTREQGFRGQVKLNGIRAVVEAVQRIPVIGNGDVRGFADADRMFAQTGCHGIAIGRGALLNPWFFRQLARREASGDPGPPAGWTDRLCFMQRHFQLQVEYLGERVACLTFRKVANWYCRALKPGHELQQRLMRIASAADFAETTARLRERGEPAGWRRDADFAIPVPHGPQERW